MNRSHNMRVATYTVGGKVIDIELCWAGDDPALDKDRFYDFYDDRGSCLNEGEPWHDDDLGVPSYEDVAAAFGGEE